MLVNLVFDYYTDIINVPDYVVNKIKKYQNQCDKWLFNKLNEHEFWIKDESGKKEGIGICSEAFVYWQNEFILNENEEKAVIVKRNLKNYDASLPTLFY